MKTIKYFFILQSISSFFILMNVYASNSNELKEMAIKTVSDFCRLEYTYQDTRERDNLIKKSPQYRLRAKKLNVFASVLQISSAYEVFAVKSYKIIDVNIKGNKAVAIVSYDVLAKRTGWKHHEYPDGTAYGEAIFVEYIKPNYIEKINLFFEGNRWWILDPPSPKISIDKVVDFYEKELEWYKEHRPAVEIGKEHPNVQKNYNEDKRNFLLLQKLAGNKWYSPLLKLFGW